jgi:hypothetical protein
LNLLDRPGRKSAHGEATYASAPTKDPEEFNRDLDNAFRTEPIPPSSNPNAAYEQARLYPHLNQV